MPAPEPLKALERRQSDPEGAITAARTLLEAICKQILDRCGVQYTGREDLPKLYRLVAMELNLAPGQHTEETFQKILVDVALSWASSGRCATGLAMRMDGEAGSCASLRATPNSP